MKNYLLVAFLFISSILLNEWKNIDLKIKKNSATLPHKNPAYNFVSNQDLAKKNITAPTDFFESNANGNWNNPASWKSSAVSSNGPWTIPATSIPSGTAGGIVIKDTITLSSNESAKLLTIDAGGFFIHSNNMVLTLFDDGTSTADFVIAANGIYKLNGTQPVYNAGSTVVVQNGGVVQAKSNPSPGESDDFSRQANVYFQSGALMDWNTSQPFQTTNVVYFPTASSSDHPIFRITATPSAALGSNNTTTFNGKFEVASGFTFTFQSKGNKIFRDGLGGNGTLIHSADTAKPCGPFILTGSSAVIDGNLDLVLRNVPFSNEMEIATGAFVTISSPNIHVGTTARPGSNLLIDGTISIEAGVIIDLENGNLALNGNIDASSAGSFKGGDAVTDSVDVSIGGLNGCAGILKFEPTSNFIDTFKMNRAGNSTPRIMMGSDIMANVFDLSSGKIVTGNNLISWNNAGNINTGSRSSYFATCTVTDQLDEIGTPLSFSLPFDGALGLRVMNVNNDLDIYFPVGPNLVSSNKIFLKNGSTLTNNPFTVSVAIGDIGYTPLPRVNRIWYIHEANPGTATADMRLYFTKYANTSGFPVSEDEVEFGFDYGDCHLIQETYVNQFIHNSNGADIMNHVPASDSSEIYAKYTRGISIGLDGEYNGIDSFSRFSIVNAQGIVLPVNAIFLQVEKVNGAVAIHWKANEGNDFKEFVLERSADGNNFHALAPGQVWEQNGVPNEYHYVDRFPIQGINFYRVMAKNATGAIFFSAIKYLYFEKANPAIHVFPNPVKAGNSTIQIQMNNVEPSLYQFFITDQLGKILLHGQTECNGTGMNWLIRWLRPPAKGIYFLHIQKDQSHWTFPILVQ